MVKISMDLRRLRYFIAVAEERNFRRAAERLHMSQPRAILASAQEAAVEVGHVGRGELGRLVIGFMSAAMLTRLAGILWAFRSMRPAVDVQLRQLPPKEQIAAVAAGHVDAGFLSIAPPHQSIAVGDVEISAESVWTEELVLALPHGHHLAGAKDISVRSLGAEAFISLPKAPDTGYYDQLVDLCHDTGAFRPIIRQEVEHLPEALALIAAGYGIGLMPVCVMESWSNLVAFRRLAERPNIAVTMIRRRDNRSPVLDAFLETMQRPQLKPLYSAHDTD